MLRFRSSANFNSRIKKRCVILLLRDIYWVIPRNYCATLRKPTVCNYELQHTYNYHDAALILPDHATVIVYQYASVELKSFLLHCEFYDISLQTMHGSERHRGVEIT